jgi:hypothetical protein
MIARREKSARRKSEAIEKSRKIENNSSMERVRNIRMSWRYLKFS